MSSFPAIGVATVKITVINTNKNKGAGKWCPWMIDVPVEVVDADRK